MKNILNVGLYIVLIFSILYLSINRISLKRVNNQLADGISELADINDFDQNLINMEQNSWQIEKLLKEEENIISIVKNDNSIIQFTDLVRNDSTELYFFLHEYSCYACLEIEFERIKHISDSLDININILCLSRGWRFIKLLQQNYNLKNNFFRVALNDPNINEELFFHPFYFIADRKRINYIFIPIKENQKRTQTYFEFVWDNFRNRDL